MVPRTRFTLQSLVSLKVEIYLFIKANFFWVSTADMELNAISNLASNEKAPYLSTMKQHLLDGALGDEGLKKMDSFNRWMSKELGDVGVIADANESFTQSSSRTYWEEVESEDGSNGHNSRRDLDGYVMSPSLSKEQLFSIIDFSPSWAYVGCEVKVKLLIKIYPFGESKDRHVLIFFCKKN